MIYRMKLADSVDEMTFDLLEVPIEDKDIEGATDNTTIDGNIFTDYLWLKKQFVQKWSLMCKDDYTQLRGFYTRQWENAEAPTYTLFAGQNRSETLTASGSAFRIQNGTQYDAPLTLTELAGNATQNGTPTPTAPVAINTTTGENVVKITGKNLFDIPTGTHTSSAVTWTITDSTISASGTANSTWTEVVARQDLSAPIPAGTYTFSIPQVLTKRLQLVLYEANGTSHDLNLYENTTSASITTTYTSTQFRLVYRAESTSVNISIPNQLQLELGSTATDYEPYHGQDYEVDLSSKNLFDKNSATAGKIIDRTTGTLVNQTDYDTSDFMPVKAGEKYTYTGFNVWYASYYDANKAFVSTPNNSTTITIPTGVAYVRCSLLHTNLDTAQFEHGTQATTYAEFYNYELAKIGTYQDRIYKDDGKWYIEKQTGKAVLTGVETWTKGSNANGLTYFYTLKSDRLAGNDVISDKFTNITTWTAVTNIDAINGSGGNTAINIMLSDTSVTTADAFKTWLASNPTTVYYPLATPTTTEITNQTLIDQLNFIANLYGGTNNIMLVGTGAQGEIGVEYTLTYEKEQTIIPETTVRLTLTDGGVINTCECRQNVQLTMRETVQ